MITFKLEGVGSVIAHMAKLKARSSKMGESGTITHPHFKVAYILNSVPQKFGPLTAFPNEQMRRDYNYNKVFTSATRFDREDKKTAMAAAPLKKTYRESMSGKGEASPKC